MVARAVRDTLQKIYKGKQENGRRGKENEERKRSAAEEEFSNQDQRVTRRGQGDARGRERPRRAERGTERPPPGKREHPTNASTCVRHTGQGAEGKSSQHKTLMIFDFQALYRTIKIPCHPPRQIVSQRTTPLCVASLPPKTTEGK